MRVAYATGWRTASELLTRQWKHVDFEGGWLRLDPGESKTGAARMFPLTPDLREVLTAQRERVNAIEKATNTIIPHVFIHDDGTPIRDFRHAWASACKLAGVAGRLVHDMRRTAVRNLERAGVSRSAAMQMTGHKTEAVYRRYAIVSEGDLRAAGAKLATLHDSEKSASAKSKVVALSSKGKK
jgi:integrase